MACHAMPLLPVLEFTAFTPTYWVSNCGHGATLSQALATMAVLAQADNEAHAKVPMLVAFVQACQACAAARQLV